MRINNNVTALNAHRMYSGNNANVTKSVSKLSSGYRINSAADDAAGLAISEKMRAQIRGLSMASKNSQDAVSLVQTAEGALQETHNILQRMRELAVQSSSDTNETSIDRGALNAEFQELKKEIDEIAKTTRFNDQNLIDGTFSKYKFSAENGITTDAVSNILMGNASAGTFTLASYTREIGAEKGAVATFNAGKGSAVNAGTVTFSKSTLTEANTSQFNDKFTLSFDKIYTEGEDRVATFKLTGTNGKSYTGTVTIGAGDTLEINFGEFGSLTINMVSSITAEATEKDLEAFNGVTLRGTGGKADVEGTTRAFMKLGEEEVEVYAGDTEVEFRSAGVTLKLANALTQAQVEGTATGTLAIGTNYAGSVTVSQTKGQSMVIQTGANEGDNLAINLDKMNTNHLGIYTTTIETREKASNAITHVNSALNLVSQQRAELGALANRLEHKIANLDTSAENLQAAESRIRDVDMAKEMTSFTKNNILAQASTAMLAQANALPQGVLQLLG